MTDFADIGIRMDSRPVAEGSKALDALAASAAAMEPKVDSATKAAGALVEASANVWRRGGDATKAVDALADSAARVEPKVDSAAKAFEGLGASSLNVWRRGADAQKSMDALGESSSRTGQKITISNGQMADTAKILQAQAEQAKAAAQANAAFGNSTNQLTLGQQQLIERFREQAATLGMSRSQLMAYQAAQMGLTTQTQQAITAVKAHEDAIKAATKAKEDAAKAANQLHDAIKLLAAGYAMLKVGEYIKDSAMLAARYETLGVVMEVVGRNAGYTKTQMLAATQAIASQGITMVESRESAVKLVQAHVDLKHATALARGAQDAAVIGHVNSSEAFDRMVNGIARGNVLILRNLGINVNLQTAYREMADSLGKTTKELTENERVQARTAAVLERLTDIHGTYTAAMDTAGKQILSMQRYTQDFKTTFGNTFNEVLTIGVMALTDHLKDSNKAITELAKNNQLEDWGGGLTSLFVGIATSVDNAYLAVRKFDTFARHMDAKKAINADADKQSKAVSDFGNGMAEKGAADRINRIEAMRASALAQENAEYETQQNTLSGMFDRFERASAERMATRSAKRKAEADAQLKVDADYAKAAKDILLKAAGGGDAAVSAAGKKVLDLYNKTYVGTPTYRDTEGRPPAEKVDQAENTRMADHLKRIETAAATEKATSEYLMRIDEMRHKAGELGDQAFYERRRGYVEEIAGAEIDSYNKQLAELRKHHNNTETETEKNAKAIHDTEDKLAAAKAKFGYDDLTRDEEDRLRAKATAAAGDDAANKYIAGLNAQVVAIEAANGKRQLSASVIAEEAAAQLRLAAAAMAVQAAGPADGGHTQADADAAKGMLTTLLLQAEAQERIAKALRDGEAATAARKLADQAIQDWKNVGQSVAESLSSAFGTAGKAAGEMFKAYADNAARQGRLDKEMALAKVKLDSDPTKLKEIDDIHRQSAQAQMKSYGDMAGAAKGFFKENTKGYKVMEDAEKAYRAVEMAMAIQSMLAKSGLLTAFTGLFVGSKATEVAATVATVPVTVAAEGVKQTALATTAMAGAVAVPFPGNIAAFGIVAAMLAAIGLGGFGGGGGADIAKDRQAAAGTGSVFGDSSAKSESISRSIALAATNSSIELTHTAGMLRALLNIQNSLAGLGNLLVRGGVVGGALPADVKGGAANFAASSVGVSALGGVVFGNLLDKLTGGAIGRIGGKVLNGIFGGNVSAIDVGLTANKTTVADALAGGLHASSYVEKKKDGGWFHSDRQWTEPTALGTEANGQVSLIISSMAKGITEAGKLLGLGGDAFTQRLNTFVVDIGKISTKGMTGEAIQKQLETVFSKVGDDMARWTVGSLAPFQKVGEGYLETLARVAANYANLDSVLQSIGMTFGATGMSSIAAREELLALAGGIDELAGKTNSFAGNFLTEAERLAPVCKYVADEMAKLGLSSIDTRDEFKRQVLGLNLSTEAGRKQYASLMGLADAFAKTHAATVDLTKSQQAIADERTDLQKQLDQLTLTRAQLLERERSALDASNRGLWDQVQAAQKAKDAQDAAKTSLGDFISKMGSFASSTKALSASLLVGNLSTLTPEQQYEQLRNQYESTKAAALGGDTTAQGNFSQSLTAFLTASQKINGGDARYTSDFAGGRRDAEMMSQWAAGQVDVAQASLNALNNQVSGIASLNMTMLQVAQSIDSLPDDLVATVAQAVLPVDYSRMGSSGNTELLAEVKALRISNESLATEVKGLRTEQRTQTGDTIAGIATAIAGGAKTVVAGLDDANTNARSRDYKVALNDY